MKFFRSFVASYGTFNRCIETADVMPFAMVAYLGYPSFVCFVVVHAVIATFIIAAHLSISHVLGPCCCSKIFLSIIKSGEKACSAVMFYMIYKIAGLAAKNGIGHVNPSFIGISPPLGIKIPISRFDCKPIVFVESRKVFDIRDGILALRERDESVRLIERLDNFVSRNTTFGHRSSFTGSLLPAAFYHVEGAKA